MVFSLYDCAYKSYRNDNTLRYILTLFVTNRQMNQEKEGKEKKIWTRVKDDAWGVQDEWENEAQMKDKNIQKNATKHKEYNMLRIMEQNINQRYDIDTRAYYMC